MTTSTPSLKWGAALLCAFFAGLALRATPTPAYAQEGARGGVVAVTAPGRGVGHNVLFVIDDSGQRLLVYEHVTGGALTLTQARNYEFDARLQEFPSPKDKKNPRRQSPSVEDIKAALK